MKKYRTSEAIAMLEKNPKQECIHGNIKSGNYDKLSVDGDYLFWGRYVNHKLQAETYPCNMFNGNVAFYYTWELVQQPVDFLTAVKAYSEGIEVEYETDGNRYDWHGVIHRKSLPKTKWYIKED